MVAAVVTVTYKVGDVGQWASGVDYTDRAAGKTFRIEFKYGPVHIRWTWLTKPDMMAATENHSEGDTKIDLKTVEPKYFICSTPGNCLGGMKLAITVVASPSSPPTPESPPPSDSVAPPPTTGDDSPPADGTHEADSGSTTPPPPPPHK